MVPHENGETMRPEVCEQPFGLRVDRVRSRVVRIVLFVRAGQAREAAAEPGWRQIVRRVVGLGQSIKPMSGPDREHVDGCRRCPLVYLVVVHIGNTSSTDRSRPQLLIPPPASRRSRSPGCIRS